MRVTDTPDSFFNKQLNKKFCDSIMERNTGLHQDPSASASNIAFSEKRLRLYKSTVNMQITVKIVLKLGADGLKMESAR